jgi:hypothetical protein
MGWFRALKTSFINNRDVLPGQAVQYDGQAGSALRPMSDDEVKKHLAALDAPPTKSVEQRLDELEVAVGRDYIAKAVARDARLRARLAADDKGDADKAPKATDAKDPTDPSVEKAKAEA